MVYLNKETWAKKNLEKMDAQTKWRYRDRLKKWVTKLFDFLAFLIAEHGELIDGKKLIGLAQIKYGDDFRVILIKKKEVEELTTLL